MAARRPARGPGAGPSGGGGVAADGYARSPWAPFFARERGERRYWLVKSEPDVFSWDDLWAAPRRTTNWDLVRNHAARNFLRDGMRRGDRVFFYHSMAEPSGVVGVCEVVREGYPEPTGDPGEWYQVDLKAIAPLPRVVSLREIRAEASLRGMALLRVGRLSVVPVTAAEWATIEAMARRGAEAPRPASPGRRRGASGGSAR